MDLQLYDYPQYSDKIRHFKTHVNRKLRCIHGYKNYVVQNQSITWVSKHSWEMLLSEFSKAEKYFAAPGQLSMILVNK